MLCLNLSQSYIFAILCLFCIFVQAYDASFPLKLVEHLEEIRNVCKYWRKCCAENLVCNKRFHRAGKFPASFTQGRLKGESRHHAIVGRGFLISPGPQTGLCS